MSRVLRLVGFALVLTLVIGLTSGPSRDRAASRAAPMDVWPMWADGRFRFGIVGDSVTSLSRDPIGAKGGDVEAVGGVDIRQGRPAIRRFVHDGAPRIVIALGTNDVARHATADEIRQRITAVLGDDVESVACVIWVDLIETPNRSFRWPQRAARFNRILDQVTAEFDRPIAHWSDLAAPHPGWFRDDGIHPTVVGRRRYASMIENNVERHC